MHSGEVEAAGATCVLGCDDTLAITTHPPLSSISLDLASAARSAVTMLRAAGRAGASRDQRYELEGSLVLRGTTG